MNLDLGVICLTAIRLVALSRDLPSNPDQQKVGGYLTIGVDGLRTMHTTLIGTVANPEKSNLYKRFSQEKAHRLQADWLRDPSSVSSWQTRQESIERYGGAVLFKIPGEEADEAHCIISFSGLKEHVDEAVSLTLGYHLGLADDETVRRIVKVSNNSVFPEMLKAYRG
jgi:hypothetical protein